MGFPKSYDDTQYKGRASKEMCHATLDDGTQCTNKAVKGRNLCGHCIDREAAKEQKSREEATAAAREREKK